MIKELEENRKFSVILLVIIALEIFLVSSIPGTSIISTGINLSTLYHLIIFFLLNFFFLMSMKSKEKKIDKIFFLVMVISLTYAVLDELHQFFVPLRSCNIIDFLVDSAGIFLAAIVYRYYPINKLFHKKINL